MNFGTKTEANPLNGILLNYNELQNIKANNKFIYDFPVPVSFLVKVVDKTSLCSQLGYGCLSPAITDGYEMAYAFNKHQENTVLVLRPSQDGALFNKRLHQEYLKVFNKEDYLKPTKLIKKDHESVSKAFDQLILRRIDEAEFNKIVTLHSRSFDLLPELYKKAFDSRDSEVSQILEQTITMALLLTLDALRLSTDWTTPSYPFRDKIVVKDQLLDINHLYRQLSDKKIWPQFRGLTLRTRALGGEKFLEKNKFGKYKVKSVYNISSNSVWLDFSEDFFENVYILSHELWHVAWTHSHLYQTQLESILNLLKTGSEKELFQGLIQFISLNELLAFEQQVRLYHSVGYLTSQWGAKQRSASGWHDSYLNGVASMTRFSRLDRLFWSAALAKPIVTIPLLLPLSVGMTFDRIIRNISAMRLESHYWKGRYETHKKNFAEKYLTKEDIESMGKAITEGVESLVQEIQDLQFDITSPAEITCDEKSKIQRLLGESWDFGIPFWTKIKPEGQICKNKNDQNRKSPGGSSDQPGKDGSHPELDPIHLGVDGSHPGLDGSGNESLHRNFTYSETLPELDGFPSLDFWD